MTNTTDQQPLVTDADQPVAAVAATRHIAEALNLYLPAVMARAAEIYGETTGITLETAILLALAEAVLSVPF